MTRKQKKRRVSLKEIAEQAGVTQSTASRILNKVTTHKYAEKTIERVLKIAREKGYQSNQLFRSAFTGKTHSAGVISPPGGSFYGPLLLGIHDRLLEDGYAMVMGFTQRRKCEQTPLQEERIVARLHEHRVDGFILYPFMDHPTDDHFRDILNAGLPLVVIDRDVGSEYVDFAGSDSLKGGRLAAAHFSELGHSKIAQFVSTDSNSSPIRDRELGFERELFDRGHIVQTINYTSFPEMFHKCKVLFSRPDRPTAVFCSNDIVASMIYRTLREVGLSVPKDVSVIGFGRLQLAAHLTPPLTTIDQKPYELGTAAAKLFLERVKEPWEERTGKRSIRVDVELFEGESCRAL